MSIESVMPSNHLILCRPLLLLPSVFPSIRVFSSESALHIRWPKYWSFSFSISPSSEYSGLISFRIDWFDLIPSRHSLDTQVLLLPPAGVSLPLLGPMTLELCLMLSGELDGSESLWCVNSTCFRVQNRARSLTNQVTSLILSFPL